MGEIGYGARLEAGQWENPVSAGQEAGLWNL
jgi:hypothetical protein